MFANPAENDLHDPEWRNRIARMSTERPWTAVAIVACRTAALYLLDAERWLARRGMEDA